MSDGPKRKHPLAAFFGIVTLLLAVLGIAVQYSYLPSAIVLGLSAAGLAVFAILAFIAALALYAVEDR